jgi:hypothetical protein
LVEQEIPVRFDPGQRLTYFAFGHPALDYAVVDINGALPAVTQLHVHMGRWMVAQVHQNTRVVEALQDRHASECSAMIAPLQRPCFGWSSAEMPSQAHIIRFDELTTE